MDTKISNKIRSLPETPGVYFFYGNEEQLLYIGMSQNIRTRVIDHFSNHNMTFKKQRIQSLTGKIKFIKTAGILGAQLRELFLIKNLQPLYNRQFKNKKPFIALKQSTDKYGYKNIGLEWVTNFNSEKAILYLMTFGSEQSAVQKLNEISIQYKLCPTKIGLENPKSRCFSFQLGRCSGACQKLISPIEYNKTFDRIFSLVKNKKWKFPDMVEITETSDNLTERIYIKNWKIIGSDLNTSINHTVTVQNNFETFRMLQRFFRSKTNQININPLSSSPNNLLGYNLELL